MVATTTLALVLGAMAVAAWLVWVAKGEYFLLWTLPWHATGLLAIIVGGATVRTRRSRHSDA
jgi:hypothetical protein